MEPEEVKKKIKTGELKVSKFEGKSEVWTYFKQVMGSDNVCVGFVECSKCGMLFTYDSKKTGTSSMNRHMKQVCHARKDDNQPSMSSFVTSPTIPMRVKQALTEKCVGFCCKDIRPFYVVSGQGFQELAQELVNIGATYGRVSAQSILPHHSTVSKACIVKAEEKREVLVQTLKDALKNGDVGMSTDMWTDDYKKISYIAITCHYVTDDFALVGKTLTTAMFPIEDAKTGKNIRREISRLLVNKFGLDPSSLNRIVWVTDEGSNIIKALEIYRRLSCLDHLINTVLRHGLQSDALADNASDIGETISAAKALVKHLKQSRLVAQLSKTVLQMGDTRFSTVYLTLKSVQDIYHELWEKLETRGELQRIENIAPDLLDFLVNFLEPFYNAQRELEGDKYPTINLVCLWVERLKNHCEPSPIDSPQQAFVRQRHAEFIRQKIKVDMLHKVALFLWPKFSKLRMMSVAEISEVHVYARTLLLPLEDGAAGAAAAESTGLTPPAARPRRDAVFAEWENQDDDIDQDDDEVAKYNSQRHVMEDDRDLLKWWKLNGLVYPKLVRLARSILCIPASSSSSERIFSAAGRTIEQRRTALKPATVDAILFLHNSM